MVIRFTRTTRAPLAKRERTDTKKWRPRTTPWEESHGVNNDAEGKLRLYLKLDKLALTLDCTPTILTATTDDTAILDSGCTRIFLSSIAQCTSKQSAHIPLSVSMPNGTSIQLSHTCDLLLTDLPHQSRKAHILPGLLHNSLISVGQLCDNGCNVTFNKDAVSLMNNETCVMLGARDPHSVLWRVDLKNTKLAIQSACYHAHDTSNQKELINYLHAACFSPVKSTWIAAITEWQFYVMTRINRTCIG
jgi:hypothetical protein